MNNFFDVELIRQDFVALDQEVHGHPLVYLDSAATALKPKAVITAMKAYYEEYPANIHRGAYYLGEIATRNFMKPEIQLQTSWVLLPQAR